MKVYHFHKQKYGFPLQMELGILEEEDQAFSFSQEVHCTDFFEIMIFRRASGSVFLDAQEIKLRDNFFLFISPFQKRNWLVDRSKTEGYFLIFEKDFFADFFADKLFAYRLQYFYNQNIPPYFTPTTRLFSFKHDILDEILFEIRNFQKDSPHLLRAILYYMLIKLNRAFCSYHQLESDTQVNNLAFLFKEALETNIREKQQVVDYAQLLNTSRISLNTAVKRQFGLTATKMIKERLLAEIKTELLYDRLSIAEIAYDLKFSDPSNLTRFFKTHMGLGPKAFRQAYQIDNSFS